MKRVLAAAGFGGLLLAGAVMAAGPESGPDRGGPGRHGPGGPSGFMRMKETLGLTDAQVAQLRKAHSDGQKQGIRRRADIQVAHMELRELMDAPTLDERAVNAKVKELTDLEAATLRARVDAHLAMRKVLTPEQQEKLRSLRPMGGFGPHRGHGEGGPGGRDGRRPGPGDGRMGEGGDGDAGGPEGDGTGALTGLEEQ